jgi:hypothetical protein
MKNDKCRKNVQELQITGKHVKFTENTAAKYLVHQNVASREINKLKFSVRYRKHATILYGLPRTLLANGEGADLVYNIHTA